MFCSRILYLIVIGGMEANEQLKELATQVITLPLAGITPDKSRSLRKRVLRLEQKYIHPFVGKAHGSKIAMIAYFFINTLIEEDYISVPPDSPFMCLADILFSAIKTEERGFELLSDSAQKQAEKMLKGLNKDGYFQL